MHLEHSENAVDGPNELIANRFMAITIAGLISSSDRLQTSVAPRLQFQISIYLQVESIE